MRGNGPCETVRGTREGIEETWERDKMVALMGDKDAKEREPQRLKRSKAGQCGI